MVCGSWFSALQCIDLQVYSRAIIFPPLMSPPVLHLLSFLYSSSCSSYAITTLFLDVIMHFFFSLLSNGIRTSSWPSEVLCWLYSFRFNFTVSENSWNLELQYTSPFIIFYSSHMTVLSYDMTLQQIKILTCKYRYKTLYKWHMFKYILTKIIVHYSKGCHYQLHR